jgi:Txe/YoeB family toxin of Txe-Axe toxin-antitoxin module
MNGRYKITFSKEFLKKIRKLEKGDQITILKRVKTLEADPYAGKPLKGAIIGLFSLRLDEIERELTRIRAMLLPTDKPTPEEDSEIEKGRGEISKGKRVPLHRA